MCSRQLPSLYCPREIGVRRKDAALALILLSHPETACFIFIYLLLNVLFIYFARVCSHAQEAVEGQRKKGRKRSGLPTELSVGLISDPKIMT